MYRSFRSHSFHSGRSYRSCRSYRFCRSYIYIILQIIQIPTGKDAQIPQISLTYTPTCEILPDTDLTPAKHAVNKRELSRLSRPPDHTEIRQIVQILQDHTHYPADHADPPIKICICMQIIHTLSRCKDRTVHTDFHSGRPYGSCRLYRSCRSMTPSNKRVQIMQIVQALSRSRRTGQAHRTDPISVEMYWFYRSHRICSDSHLSMKIVTTQIPFTCACHGDQPDHTWLTNANDTERTCRPTQTIWRVYITDPPDHAGRSYTSCTHGTQILQLGTRVQSLRPSRYHRQIKGDTSTLLYKSCRSYKSFRSCRPAH